MFHKLRSRRVLVIATLGAIAFVAGCSVATSDRPVQSSQSFSIQPRPARTGPAALVLLPAGQSPELLLAADLLAETLGKSDDLLVVDRQQFDRLLREKNMEDQSPPTVAWDVLVRLRTGSPGANELVVECIDLSCGNIRAAGRFPLQMEALQAKMPDLAALCRRGAQAAIGPQRRVRVRLLGVGQSRRNARMEPMADQLERILRQSVEKSTKAEVVEHLEAMTAKEESLMLYLGLSRLGEGAQFVPQADATLEGEVREEEAEGKDFPSTPLLVRFQLNLHGREPTPWTEFRGTVSQWEEMASRLAGQLARQLGETNVQPLMDEAVELVRRRAQAEAELAALLGSAKERAHNFLDADPQAIAAVVKIDPTYELAAWSLVRSLNRRELPGSMRARAILEAWRYVERFNEDPDRRRTAINIAADTAASMGWTEKPSAGTVWTDGPPVHEVLGQLAERGIQGPIRYYSDSIGILAEAACRAMKEAGVDYDQWRQWMDDMIAQAAGRNDQAMRQRSVLVWYYRRALLRIRRGAIRLAAEQGDAAWAGAVVRQVMTTPAEAWTDVRPLDDVRRTLATLNDVPLLVEFDKWARSLKEESTGLTLRWRYPSLGASASLPPLPAEDLPAATPLAVGEGWLLCLSSIWPDGRQWQVKFNVARGSFTQFPQRLALLKMREDGSLLGPAEQVALPKSAEGMEVECAAWCAGRFIVGTRRSGLLIGVPGHGQWKQITPKEGLPGWRIHSLTPVDDRTLLCFSGRTIADDRAVFFFDVPGETVRLAGRASDSPGEMNLWNLRCAWSHQGLWYGLNAEGLVSDALSVQRQVKTLRMRDLRGALVKIDPFNDFSLAATRERLWIVQGGLYEMGRDGKAIPHVWNRVGRGAKDNKLYEWFNVTATDFEPVPGSPDHGYLVAAAASGQYVFVCDGTGVLCYSVDEDTWYGPLLRGPRTSQVQSGPAYLIGGRNGVYLSGSPVRFLSTADFLAAARKAGCMVGASQVDDRRRELAAGNGPLAQAQLEMGLYKYERAAGVLADVLRNDPSDATALFLMGIVHGPSFLNQPEESLKYFRRLAELDDPKAVHTGLTQQMEFLLALDRKDEAAEVAKEILARLNLRGDRQRRVLIVARQWNKPPPEPNETPPSE